MAVAAAERVMIDGELLTPAEVGALFRVDAKTVTRWALHGRLTGAIRTPGGHRRWRAEDIRKLLTPENAP